MSVILYFSFYRLLLKLLLCVSELYPQRSIRSHSSECYKLSLVLANHNLFIILFILVTSGVLLLSTTLLWMFLYVSPGAQWARRKWICWTLGQAYIALLLFNPNLFPAYWAPSPPQVLKVKSNTNHLKLTLNHQAFISPSQN